MRISNEFKGLLRLWQLLILFTVTSCAPKIVTVTEFKERVVFEQMVDSVYIKDSIATIHKNDTIFLTKYLYKYKYQLIRDSVYVRDSIPYEVLVPVEKIVYKTRLYERVLMYLGLLSIIILIITMIKKRFFKIL